MKNKYFLFITLSLTLLTSSARAAESSLYQRLGEKRGIAAVVDSFVNLAASDAKVNFTRDGKFKGMDVPYLKGQLTDFISMVTGGPVKYVGKDMKTAHAGMKIKGAEFDALANDLAITLDKFKVPANEKKELLTLVASTKNTIVEQAISSGPRPLYDRLGGRGNLEVIVDAFVPLAAKDSRVNFFRNGRFKTMDVQLFKVHLVDFLAMATGGPKAYRGSNMKAVHSGMGISGAEFDALAEDLSITFDRFKIPLKLKDEFMAIAASTKADIVEVSP